MTPNVSRERNTSSSTPLALFLGLPDTLLAERKLELSEFSDSEYQPIKQ